ncbi:MAG: excinuclease ABC subunit UvrC [Dehalococcoidales bacterium]|nr:excinuclease ABC subunit UvrC [Dehalococcoidales bacterium]
MVSSLIAEQLARLPNSPGVYLMKDPGGAIIYVGKASNLHNRLRSYFAAGEELTPKIEQMVPRIDNIDFIVTGSEQEALILEATLVKKYHPRFNVRLKDDKSFPYLKVETGTAWPRVYMTRRMDGSAGRYFGPFASVKSLKQSMKVLKRIFPFRFCTKPITGVDSRACLEYHIGQCLAPCIGAVSEAEYAEVIRQVILFLEGKQEKIVRMLEKRMSEASESLDFERAARLRDQIQSIHDVIEAQRIAAKVRGEQDVIAFAQDGDTAYVQVFFVRNNKLTGRESFVLQGTLQEEPGQIMSSFIKQFYAASPSIPPLLLLQYQPDDVEVIRDWLRDKRKGRVDIQVPERGNKRQLVAIVEENARQGLEHMKIKRLAAPNVVDAALAEAQRTLQLKSPPQRIEGYDISNIQGRFAVGSMVVFEEGRPRNAHYRRFRIRTVAGADDYAMLQEVLTRRFKRSQCEASDTWAVLPDLILIDGGKGQLNAACAAMKASGVDLPVMGLAKENEEIFVPGKPAPIVLPKSNLGLQLLQRVRDEAHRFAISYFTRTHKRESFTSALDGVPGIGPKRRRALLRKFGSVQGIKDASMQDLADADGMTQAQAKKVKEHL